MEIIYMLLAISVCVAIVFFVAFIITVKRGQYDDVYTPSVRMLFDDELVKNESTQLENNHKATEPQPINE
ncbi:cytochrome oxidase maturation protein, cbb3-type [Nonlabens spongiae]|uniref:Cytochrome oxidase maturation protein, cbb3-type n=1 Tax=Nonlabens spongiae TaxID=331648 RepID=A0A1W6MMQ9_9FLAO|nr:cbb3-type cytochrome oxidase assembly protein CcoS [Nonlabens spongiae]ARN78861.1 cytochrome oxidase maturation protein, cbb3-type [Nonlabens spongiae]